MGIWWEEQEDGGGVVRALTTPFLDGPDVASFQVWWVSDGPRACGRNILAGYDIYVL